MTNEIINQEQTIDEHTSKTKIGAVILGISAALATSAAWYLGSINAVSALSQYVAELGAVCLAFGIRDLPILN